MKTSLLVRRLHAGDARAYLGLRQRSAEELGDATEPRVMRELEAGASGITRSLAACPPEVMQVRGVFDADTLVAAAGLSRAEHAPYGAVGVLWGVYVLPRYRGTPASRLLMETIIGHGGAGGAMGPVMLAPCRRDNLTGRRFLQRFGFESMGPVVDAMLAGGHDGDCDYLVRELP